MSAKLLDISNKIDSSTLEVLKLISEAADSVQANFFIIGATARDIIFNLVHNINIYRATNDIDFSVRLRNWDDYKKQTDVLLSKGFSSSNIVHKFQYKSIPGIDIIPLVKFLLIHLLLFGPIIRQKL